MIVCICHQVSDRDITRQAHAGLDFRGIQRALGVATRCGRCEGCAREVVRQCQGCALPAQAPPHPGTGTKAVAWSPA